MCNATVRYAGPYSFKTILLLGGVAGMLDIISAILLYDVIQQKASALKILQSIASGVFGNAAYEGGVEMGFYGLFFHFVIAFCFAAVYWFVFPYIRFLKKYKILSGVLYGIFIWMIMNLVVLPITFHRMLSFTWAVDLPGIIVLILAVGLPVSVITHYRYNKYIKAP